MEAQENRGKLELILGPMYAGKTTKLISMLEERGGLIIKPTIDNRFSISDVVTHDGKKIKAYTCKDAEEILSLGDYYMRKNIFIDEIQFFDDMILNAIEYFKSTNKNVIASGLYTTFEGKPFPLKNSQKFTMTQIVMMADKIHRLYAKCNTCGEPASYTAKIGGSNKIVEVGGKELYVPMCGEHFYAHLDK